MVLCHGIVVPSLFCTKSTYLDFGMLYISVVSAILFVPWILNFKKKPIQERPFCQLFTCKEDNNCLPLYFQSRHHFDWGDKLWFEGPFSEEFMQFAGQLAGIENGKSTCIYCVSTKHENWQQWLIAKMRSPNAWHFMQMLSAAYWRMSLQWAIWWLCELWNSKKSLIPELVVAYGISWWVVYKQRASRGSHSDGCELDPAA